MSDSQLQFKFLDAGAKSSAVILDPNLHTSNEQTLYLYHHQRGQIIEYRRDIVEAKLRELNSEEEQEAATLQQAYQQVRASFTPRGAVVATIPERAPPPKAPPPRSSDDEIGLIVDNDLLDDELDDVG